eukprot:COSAG02_NODE_989_length_15437_cov_95.731860_3_plen_360_part_00
MRRLDLIATTREQAQALSQALKGQGWCWLRVEKRQMFEDFAAVLDSSDVLIATTALTVGCNPRSELSAVVCHIVHGSASPRDTAQLLQRFGRHPDLPLLDTTIRTVVESNPPPLDLADAPEMRKLDSFRSEEQQWLAGLKDENIQRLEASDGSTHGRAHRIPPDWVADVSAYLKWEEHRKISHLGPESLRCFNFHNWDVVDDTERPPEMYEFTAGVLPEQPIRIREDGYEEIHRLYTEGDPAVVDGVRRLRDFATARTTDHSSLEIQCQEAYFNVYRLYGEFPDPTSVELKALYNTRNNLPRRLRLRAMLWRHEIAGGVPADSVGYLQNDAGNAIDLGSQDDSIRRGAVPPGHPGRFYF